MLGSYDLLQGRYPEQATERLERFLAGISLDRSKILLIAPPPMAMGEWVPSPQLIEESLTFARLCQALAERLGLHPSTISRATREKYLQCRQGTYPLRYFFSRALGEQGPSQQTVKLRLLELIRQEDRKRPFSDQKLAELLEDCYRQGYRHFICGMAQGADMYFGEAVLALRE